MDKILCTQMISTQMTLPVALLKNSLHMHAQMKSRNKEKNCMVQERYHQSNKKTVVFLFE